MVPGRFRVDEDVIYQPLDDEIVLLNMSSQRYFGLDNVAAEIWKLLIEHGDIRIVEDEISATYDVDRDTVRRDIECLVRDLVAAGLLKPADEVANL